MIIFKTFQGLENSI